MKRALLLASILFSFGAMCSGIATDDDEAEEELEEEEEEKEVVVVPVKDGDPEAFCCAYSDGDATRYDLADGATECAEDHGDDDGEWVQNVMCTPCCCDNGGDFEVTTAHTCATGDGECLAADARECAAKGEKGKGKGRKTKPEPSPRPKPSPKKGKMRKP